MDIFTRRKSICLTGNVPNVRCDSDIDYSGTDSDGDDIHPTSWGGQRAARSLEICGVTITIFLCSAL